MQRCWSLTIHWGEVSEHCNRSYESNRIKVVIQVQGKKEIWRLERWGQLCLCSHAQLSPSAHKNITVCGTTLALSASPVDSPDCLPGDREYHNPLIRAPLHFFWTDSCQYQRRNSSNENCYGARKKGKIMECRLEKYPRVQAFAGSLPN